MATATDVEGVLLQSKRLAEALSMKIQAKAANRTIRIVFDGIVDSIETMIEYVQLENPRGALNEFGRLTVLFKQADKALNLGWTQKRLGDSLRDIKNDLQVLKNLTANASTDLIDVLEKEVSAA